jgi:MFS family permease
VASAFIGDTFPPEKRGGALGLIGSVWGFSGLLGPILGGLLLSYGWQWLFIINIPIAAIVIALGFKILPQSKKENTTRFDWYGTAVLALLVSSLAYGVNQINTTNFVGSVTSVYTWPFLIAAVLLLPVLVRIERRAEDPVIEVNLLKSREVKIASSISIGTGLNQTAIVFLPAFAVTILALTTSQASLMVIPLVITLGVSAPLIGRLLDKFGSKKIIFFGTLILFLGLFMLSALGKSFYLFIISGMVIGLGLSSVLGSPLRYIMLSESPANKRAAGQALININSSVGQLVGGALIGAVIASQGGKALGYQSAYFLIGCVAIVMAFLALGLKKQKEQLATMKSNNG